MFPKVLSFTCNIVSIIVFILGLLGFMDSLIATQRVFEVLSMSSDNSLDGFAGNILLLTWLAKLSFSLLLVCSGLILDCVNSIRKKLLSEENKTVQAV